MMCKVMNAERIMLNKLLYICFWTVVAYLKLLIRKFAAALTSHIFRRHVTILSRENVMKSPLSRRTLHITVYTMSIIKGPLAMYNSVVFRKVGSYIFSGFLQKLRTMSTNWIVSKTP